MPAEISKNKAFKELFQKPRKVADLESTPRDSTALDSIALGDAARSRSDWPAAAFHYREAVERDPTFRHGWLQLGHMERECGDRDAAERAYRAADALAGDDGDPALYLGHLAKLNGDMEEAKHQLLRANAQNPDNAEALSQVRALVDGQGAISEAALDRSLRRRTQQRITPDATALAAIDALIRSHRDLDPETAQQLISTKALIEQLQEQGGKRGTASDGAAGLGLVFDASDLLAYFRNARLPTGIQRVQIEVISNAVLAGNDVRICSFSDSGGDWNAVPVDIFLDICALAVQSGDRDEPAWVDAIDELTATQALAEKLEFPAGATLVNLGTSWWLQNYFLFVRQAKEQHGIRYVPFVHDLIPIMTPEHCVKALTQDFISWTQGVFQHADFFLVNSEATKTDLLKVAGTLGHDVDQDLISVIPLNADFRREDAVALPASTLARWHLRADRYVLFVSTIESRKNHLLAFDAWQELMAKHGPTVVPKLVCVGNDGWLNDAVFERLKQNPALAERVVMLSKLSDAELALLYRNCLCTLYTSQYEGWGLPVTESLCYGKVPVISDSSSLPEAGGEFALYFKSGSKVELGRQLDRILFDDAFRAGREQQVVTRFKPRHWSDIARQIIDELGRLAHAAGEPRAVRADARMGAFHPIQRNFETRIWDGFASGEIFRAGNGWWWPDDWGCWTKPKGGLMRVGIPEDAGPLRLYMLLQAPPDGQCQFNVDIGMGDAGERGTLDASEFRWLAMDVPASTGPLEIVVEGSAAVDLGPRTGGLDMRVISVGVAGFFLCPQLATAERLAIMEAILLRSQMSLAFNREPIGRTGASRLS